MPVVGKAEPGAEGVRVLASQVLFVAFTFMVDSAGNAATIENMTGDGYDLNEELRASAPAGGMVVVMGAPALAVRYERALAHLGVPTRRVGSEATWRGLWAIAQTLERGTP